MNFNKFVKEFENFYKIDTSKSLIEKYLIPIIPTIGKFLIDYCSGNKINYDFYVSMFVSLLFPIITDDLLKIRNKKSFGKNLISVIFDTEMTIKNFKINLNLIYENNLLKVKQLEENNGWKFCNDNKKLIDFFIMDSECYNMFICIDNIEYNFFLCHKYNWLYIHGKCINKLNIITKFILNYKKKRK